MSFHNIGRIVGSDGKKRQICPDKKEMKGRRKGKGNVKRGEIRETLDGDQDLVIGKETENVIEAVIEKKGMENIEIGVGKGIIGTEEMIEDTIDRVHPGIEMKKDMVGHVEAQEMTDMKDPQELKNKQRTLERA